MLCLRNLQKFHYSFALALIACTTASLPTTAQSISASGIVLNAEAARSSYILGPGDHLDITVFEYEEFTGSKVVLPDGTITMPLIGIVLATGKTTQQLATEINRRLTSLLVNPVVTVNLMMLRPVVVNVAGEVQRPGKVQLRSLSTTNSSEGGNIAEANPTLTIAIMQAGGITQDADIRQVILRRYDPDGISQPITINLWDAISSENVAPDLILQDGDSIYVPKLAANDTLDRRLIARSSFAPATVRVRVVGEVNSPGEVQVPPSSSLSSAVAIAGGPTDDARLSHVAFVRMNENGKIERQEIDLRNLVDNYQVQDGDVIIVPKTGATSFLDFAGRLLSPLGVILNLFKP
ncbi:MAG: polysaccharide biosynthesis/export family protein [Oscillatoriophycideae cyanobacterium NC_groundwater_1537_Pr4_S-0.65um_50_18]|nr:polysaccharide biosynthesis/export family protein [Oscillatoriophycideae cyanobacterium NC_groundwater_1537_Pr4_S-0.65um_50_18]